MSRPGRYPGVIVAAIGWAALQALFQIYVAISSSSESAGPIGAILLLLTWLYFGGLILLVGGVVNATRSGHIEIESDETAAGDGSLETIPEDADRDPFVNSNRYERDRLEAQLTELRRERDQLRNDRDAQRTRRYRLEDRVDALEVRIDRLEADKGSSRTRTSGSGANSRPVRGRRGDGGHAASCGGSGR